MVGLRRLNELFFLFSGYAIASLTAQARALVRMRSDLRTRSENDWIKKNYFQPVQISPVNRNVYVRPNTFSDKTFKFGENRPNTCCLRSNFSSNYLGKKSISTICIDESRVVIGQRMLSNNLTENLTASNRHKKTKRSRAMRDSIRRNEVAEETLFGWPMTTRQIT